MHIRVRNVNDGFWKLINDINEGVLPTIEEETRNGPVMSFEDPVMITCSNPMQRVLFNQGRDANPFFHLVESLWMLNGNNDLKTVEFFASNMKNYSDDGQTLNGAYGYRWRKAIRYYDTSEGGNPYHVDQVSLLIDHLIKDPGSRRAVLSMWNVEDDLLKIDTSKDVCCNTEIQFRIIGGGTTKDISRNYLDMTVINRSNDLVWGTFGANVVHMSFLQEYIARSIGCRIGNYHQFTNNLHIYKDKWKPDKYLANPLDYYDQPMDTSMLSGWDEVNPPSTSSVRAVQPLPLFASPAQREQFDREVSVIVGGASSPNFISSSFPGVTLPFLSKTVLPMIAAFHCHKKRDYTQAFDFMTMVQAADWRIAGTAWLERREKTYESKTNPNYEG